MRNLERRIVYLIMLMAVAVPIVFRVALPPARMMAAEKTYALMNELPSTQNTVTKSEVAFVWIDFGPNTIAENEPQAEVIIEHLFRKRIPVIIATQYQLAEAFLSSIPKGVATRLSKEIPDQKWEYGTDWISIGYQPMGALFLQSLAKSDNISEFLKKDFYGTPFAQLPNFAHIGNVKDVKFVGQFTGLVGTLDNFIQYFQKDGYHPTLVHGCTSITIPEAYIFLDSGQISGLLEGISGAAWYSDLMSKTFPARIPDRSGSTNTALGVSQVMILLLIVAGNVVGLLKRKKVGGRIGA